LTDGWAISLAAARPGERRVAVCDGRML